MATFQGQVVMHPTALAALLRGPSGPVYRTLMVAGEALRTEAKRRVGYSQPDPLGRAKKGPHLRDTIVKRMTQGPTGPVLQVGSDAPHALLHHEGTQPHVIVPVKAPRLVFWSGSAGRVIYARRVNHPGSRPNRYLSDSLGVLRRFF